MIAEHPSPGRRAWTALVLALAPLPVLFGSAEFLHCNLRESWPYVVPLLLDLAGAALAVRTMFGSDTRGHARIRFLGWLSLVAAAGSAFLLWAMANWPAC